MQLRTKEEVEPLKQYTLFGVVNGKVESLKQEVTQAACDNLCMAAASFACMIHPGWWTFGYPAANDCIIRGSQICGGCG